MTKMKLAMAMAAICVSGSALADEYVMTCEEALTTLNREVTEQAMERYSNLKGACLGVVDRDGDLYMQTKAVIRKANSRGVTLYVPATDRTFDTTPSAESRVLIQGKKVRPRDLARGQEINIYLAVEKITQPIEEVGFDTEADDDNVHLAPAAPAAALPTTG